MAINILFSQKREVMGMIEKNSNNSGPMNSLKNGFSSILSTITHSLDSLRGRVTSVNQNMSPKEYFQFYNSQLEYAMSRAIQDRFNTKSTWDEAYDLILVCEDAYKALEKDMKADKPISSNLIKLDVLKQMIVGHIKRYGSVDIDKYIREPAVFII